MPANVNINFNVHLQVDNLRDFIRALNELTSLEVAVGIPEEKAERNGDEKDGVNNALIGYVNNYGYPALGIPARNHLESGIEEGRDQITSELARAGEAVLDGKSPQVGFHRAGLAAQNAIRAKIGTNLPPPLRPGTIRARVRRGHAGTNTLQETGQYRNAISYVLQPAEGFNRAEAARRETVKR